MPHAPGPPSQETILLNAPAGALRAIARLRPTKRERSRRATRFHRRSVVTARGLGLLLSGLARALHLGPEAAGRPRLVAVRRHLAIRLASERIVPIVAAIMVLGASILSLQPATAQPVGNTTSAGTGPRIAVGGETGTIGQLDPLEVAGLIGGSGTTGTVPGNGVAGAPAVGSDPAVGNDPASGADPATGNVGAPQDSSLDDGTIYKPVAVDTTVQDGKALLRTYTVQSGDTLTGIASRFGVSMMTVWWANRLTSKDDLRVGQELVIPPVNGLVITVKAGDTLDSLAAANKVDPAEVIALNQLEDPTLVIGQTLILPDAVGAAIPTPKPVPPTRSSGTRSSGSSGTSSGGPSTYAGGAFVWPVVGGGNYISRGFIYGHYGLDIAADYGVEVQAAAAGKVLFAGWKNNGGGYQVWISHGSGLYTTYNHLASVSVAAGQSVERGQQIGRNGSSGNSTGPHTHFEVWIGEIWNGGTRVNPLRYY